MNEKHMMPSITKTADHVRELEDIELTVYAS